MYGESESSEEIVFERDLFLVALQLLQVPLVSLHLSQILAEVDLLFGLLLQFSKPGNG